MSGRRGRGRGRGGAGNDNNEGDVRGPTSALTSFLREKGIVAPQNDRFRARQRREEAAAPAAAPIQEEEAENEAPAKPEAGPSRLSKSKRIQDSDHEEEEIVTGVASTSKTVIPEKPAKKLSAAAMKKKQAAKKDQQDDEEAMVPAAPPKLRYGDRTPGAFVYCHECGTKFTFTKYTPYTANGKGVLCPPCQQENGVENNKGGGENAEKKRSRAVKPKPQPIEKPKAQVKTLQNSCIHMIGKNIEIIEELGDIGSINLDKICMIVCKNRGLTAQTIKLFLDMASNKLALYDCARLDAAAYELIAMFAPKLRHLTLDFCGALKDDVLKHLQARLTKLIRLELYGAFLITPTIWENYFDSFMVEGRDPLEGFLLRQSPRFDAACVGRLANNFPNLSELRLAEIQLLDDDALKLLHPLKNLRMLDLSRAGLLGQNLTDDGVVPLLENVGANLETLVLDENEYLTDRVLIEGIRPHCHKLRHLGLKQLPDVLPDGVVGLFGDWSENCGLETLNIARCIELDDASIEAIVKHSGLTLRELDMNSVDKDVTEKGIRCLTRCAALKTLDIGFVRSLDDFLMKEILHKCENLTRLSVFGCNRVTDHAPSRQGVKILGSSQFKVEY